MAALQSTRAAANSSRPLQPHRTPAPDSSSPPLSVFLTNLQLLDLDLLPDWPGISPMTFATSGAGVPGQKRRIQCVEWALFRLFSLRDPQEAANKLKPFFPPLDQMQSLNLRAALLRALDNAKKNGVLGRDLVIRKTMLDECKGERLEEVLAYFSTAVLKRVVARDAQRVDRHPALAAELVLEERGYQGNNAELVALALAHRLSLRRILERKEVARARYRDFAHLLTIKERAMARRNDVVRHREQQGGGGTVSENVRAEMRRTVRNNWSGNESWINVLLAGTENTTSRGLLAEPFDRVWRRVQQGRLAELEESGGDLLEQLDTRVRMQRERLQKWEAFRVEAFRHKPAQQPSSPVAHAEANTARGLDLNFVHHQDLQFGLPSIGRVNQPLTQEYAGLVNKLQDELTRIRSPCVAPNSLLPRPRAQRSNAGDQGSVSEISDLEDDVGSNLAVKPSEDPVSTKPDASGRLPGAQHDAETMSIEGPGLSQKYMSAAQLFDHDMHVLDPVGRKSLWQASSSPSPSPRPSPVREMGCSEQESLMDSRRALSPTQELADHILESMDNASPSPNKRAKPRHTLSLAQRTRLSMARTDNLFLEGDEPESPLESPAGDEAAASPGLAVVDSKASADQDGAEDLVSRTRRSMAGFEKAKLKAQLERRRSQRKSRAPPRKEGSSFPTVEEEGGLKAEDPVCEEDMEAVFRSRPKIKASPIPSPTRDLSQDSCE
ncbi:hypothetical protein HRG_008285 [Hirsutella rhossiliensis]|uniref:HAUS augmin-like complex subunit 6 N-terminal domain-containing protein n=1 Tax=Hirsutella rhossiliensis TaxID=111463 RepID=A0A9P8MU62_9HYPO|nr:uncharacterized protein HRG_08285 [Hirsutella rhossiliensis]KAH0961132.1 hypothetical protein HRG_08285 [Hirsutella rhossiliensis]